MRKCLIIVGFCLMWFLVIGAEWRESTFLDFADGDTSRVKILSPDPDGTDDGALWLPSGRDTIYVLQVYPDGHNTTLVADAFRTYGPLGSPPLNIVTYVMPISAFRSVSSCSSYVSCTNPLTGANINVRLLWFDILYFGIGDSYGGAGNDLSTSATQAVREFARLGKGVIFTHDTIWDSGSGTHPNFNSLTDISGLSASYQPWTTFTTVKRVVPYDTARILRVPFVLPPMFNTTLCHQTGQYYVSGTTWYVGTDASGSANYGIYWHSYYNPSYNSYGAYFSYGHIENPPLEYEAKAMINTLFFAYFGGLAQGVYTSSVFNAGCLAMINEISWSADIASNCSLYVELAIDTSLSGTGAWTEWRRIPTSGYRNPFGLLLSRRFRYRVGFSRYAGASPSSNIILHWIRISYDCCSSTSLDSVWFSEETVCNDSNWVSICYSFSGCPADVVVRLSSNGGASWNVPLRTLRNADNDTGRAVLPGIHCFDWLASFDYPYYESQNFAVGVSLTVPEVIQKTTRADFLPGDTSHVRILSPDPDGMDDGALWLPAYRDTIYVLQVYPDGHCLDCMSSPIYNYMGTGTPPLNIKIYLIPITSFNSNATSPTSSLSVRYITPSGTLQPPETRRLDYFDVIIFGVADCYARYDLTPASRDAVLSFMRLGKGLILTHDTATNWPDCGNHINFCSLTEVTGISCYDVSGWSTYTSVRRNFDPPGVPVLHTPFEIPTTFSVLLCHWLRQRVDNGWILYVGNASPGGPNDNLLYWHGYHNTTYNSFSSFFNYGHTEAVPLEWEAKSMINCIYFAYHGGIGSGVYTSAPERLTGAGYIVDIDYSATVPAGAMLNVEFAVDTVVGSGEGWTGWMDLSALPFDHIIDGIRYRVGFTRNGSGESPILHWIQFVVVRRLELVRRGILDTNAPRVSISCPARILGGYDQIFRWAIEDSFYRRDDGYIDIYGCGIRERYTVRDTFFTWRVPNIDCARCTLIVSVRDSFCNWGVDTCTFAITRSLPNIEVSLVSDSLRCLPGGRIVPSPFRVRAYVRNTGTGPADSAYIYLNITDCFRIVGGTNPARVFLLSPGEVDSVLWSLEPDRRCEGRNECFSVRAISFP